MMRRSFKIVLHAILTSIPTVLGYVLGPLTHTINLVLSFTKIPIGIRLGFMSLTTVIVIARLILGKGAALTQGFLLAITGAIFHHSQSPLIIVPRDILLGVGIEITLSRTKGVEISAFYAILASIVGGLLSYLPYLIFLPLEYYHLALITSILLMPNFIISCIIGGYIALELSKQIQKIIPLIKS